MDKPELNELIICRGLLCGLQGGYLLILAGKNCGHESLNLILQGPNALVMRFWRKPDNVFFGRRFKIGVGPNQVDNAGCCFLV
jgi:hypothetical protein